MNTLVKTAVPVTLSAFDADGDPLNYRLVSKPVGGKLSGKLPNLVFKPKATFTGTVSFTYVANDGIVDSAPITIHINVFPAPAATARSLTKATAGAGVSPLPEMS